MQPLKRASGWIALVVTLVAAGFVLRSRVHTGWLPAGDLYTYFYPKVLYALASLHDGGHGLLWNPFQNCGQPFFGVSQTGLLYPPFWLYLVFDPERALRAVLFVQLVIGGFGTYLLCRALGARPVAAIAGVLAFEMGNSMLRLIVSCPIHSAPYVWMPVALFCCERLLHLPTLRRAAALALVLAIAILPGMPQTVFFIYLLIGFRVLWELMSGRVARPLPLFGVLLVGLILPPLLAAVQLFPEIETARASLRSGALSAREINPYGSWELAKLGQQLATGKRTQPFLLIPCLVGLVSLSAARTRRPGLFYVAAATLSFGIAFGPGTPLYDLYSHLPMAGAFRLPTRFLWVTSFCLAILTALGIEALATEQRTRRWERPLLLSAITLPLLGWSMFAPNGLSMIEWQAAGLTVAAGVVALALPPLARWTSSLVLVALVLQLLWAPSSAVLFLLRSAPDFFATRATFDALAERMGPQDRAFLVHGKGHRFMAKSASLYRLPSILDYEPLVTRRYAAFSVMMRAGRLLDNLNDSNYHGPRLAPGFIRRLFDLTAARYVASVAERVPRLERIRPPLRRIATIDDLTIFENPRSQPRAFYVPRVEVIPDPDALLARMASGPEDLRQVAFVEESPFSGFTGVNPPRGPTSVRFIRNDPEHVQLEVEAPARGFVVLTDQYFPGWVATVDGRSIPIQRANYAFRLVEVPSGRSAVDFRYEPASLRWGAAVSVASLLLVTLLLWSSRARPDDFG